MGETVSSENFSVFSGLTRLLAKTYAKPQIDGQPKKRFNMSALRAMAREMLVNRSCQVTLQMIEKDTGLKVTWLSDFANNNFENVSVERVEKVFNYFSPRPLEEILKQAQG